MRVKVLFFGPAREIAGALTADLELDPGATLETVLQRYASEFPKLGEMGRGLVLARNEEFAPGNTVLHDGDEVAFLPPVSGGAAGPYTQTIEDPEGHFFALTRAVVDVREIAARVLRGCDGAVVTFEGVVRDNTRGRATLYLDYEGYETMAIKVMAELGRSIAASHAVDRIALVHRLGRMEIGETSVAVIVSAPHRKAAFDAAREGIDRLKKTVPIWKKEYFTDGEVWAEGEWDNAVSGS